MVDPRVPVNAQVVDFASYDGISYPLRGVRERRSFASASFTTAPELVSFVRRTPDPTLQLVSARTMSGLPSTLSAEVARQNFATVTAQDPARLDLVLRDIRRDRDESYARLGS